jgi:PHD/YefM family antitoxin component YafN of YafNO toxin-antitoxin module
MPPVRERYIVDRRGKRVAVVLDIKEYERLIEELEMLEDIRAYEEAKREGDEFIPLDQAFDEIESDA